MNIRCEDRERLFLDGTAEEWAALERHAATCAECAEEVKAWKSLSLAAEELRDYTESAALWTRIEVALQQQEAGKARRAGFWETLAVWRHVPTGWQAALAGALVLALAVLGGYLYTHRQTAPVAAGTRLLKSKALADVERTEREYMQAIDKLAVEAKPQLDSATPLMTSYREKLLVLDGAIEELRAQAGQNPSNAHLRYQLLAMYEEKQQTLQDILETKQ